jgi:uncharacterized protein YegL
MKKQPLVWFVLFTLVALLLAACGDSAPAMQSGMPGAPTSGASYPATTAAATTAASAATTAAAASAIKPGQPDNAQGAPIPTVPKIDQNPLQAGAVDDNLKYDEYISYLRNFRGNVLPFDVNERYIINVVDRNSRTVADAKVTVFSDQRPIFEGKTYSNGQILFFPRAFSAAAQSTEFEIAVEKAGVTTRKTFSRANGGQNQGGTSTTWMLELPGALRPQLEQSPNLDLLFLLDSTGSMGGEIAKIQQTIDDIAAQIKELPGTPKVRYSVVTYRDRGDAYVTRKFGFTASLNEFSSFLNTIRASGGGDIPEALNEGLHVAISEMNWNRTEAVRLVFLVADAPPHLDYKNDYKYTDEAVVAMREGIKIYTIGASGLDKQGEYVFRQMAMLTLSQYLFITRGGDEKSPGSGGPASSTDTVYVEKNLDKMVINIVRREITNLTT